MIEFFPGTEAANRAFGIEEILASSSKQLPHLDELLTPNEVGDLLKVSVKMVTRLIESGKLPASNVGLGSNKRRYRIKRSNVEEFLLQHQIVRPFEIGRKGIRRRRQALPGVVDHF